MIGATFFSSPCAPPCHKDSDDLLAMLSVFHFKMYDQDFINSIIDRLNTIEVEKIEYSRIQFIHAISVMSGAISDFSSRDTPKLKIHRAKDFTYFIEDSFVQLKKDYNELIKSFDKNFSKNQLKKLNYIFFIATENHIFVNNINIDKKIKEYFENFYNILISKYEELNNKAINIFKNYKYESILDITLTAQNNFDKLINFDKFNISASNLNRTSYLSGSKEVLWYDVQKDEYPENIRLSKTDLEELRLNMIDIFTFFNYLIMDSSYSKLLCQLVSIKFYVQNLEEHLEKESKIKYIEENTKFCYELTQQTNMLFNQIKKNKNTNTIIIKEQGGNLIINHPKSDKTLVIYQHEMHHKNNCYGIAFNEKIDFENIPSIEDVLKINNLKTSCFNNKIQFLREFEQQFVQEFFFEIKINENYNIEFV